MTKPQVIHWLDVAWKVGKNILLACTTAFTIYCFGAVKNLYDFVQNTKAINAAQDRRLDDAFALIGARQAKDQQQDADFQKLASEHSAMDATVKIICKILHL